MTALCDLCGEKFPLPGEHACEDCLLYLGDDDLCPSCGSLLTNDRTCVCDLNRPAADWTYWRAA